MINWVSYVPDTPPSIGKNFPWRPTEPNVSAGWLGLIQPELSFKDLRFLGWLVKRAEELIFFDLMSGIRTIIAVTSVAVTAGRPWIPAV